MKSNDAAQSTSPATKRDESGLARRYGKIGIPAVAAALACTTEGKDEPEVAPRVDPRFIEAAA
jgi:hypothetical protein